MAPESQDERSKARRAFGLLIDILKKVRTAYEWNERLHEVHDAMAKYEDLLPERLRNDINTVARRTDTRVWTEDQRELIGFLFKAVEYLDSIQYVKSYGKPKRTGTKLGVAIVIAIIAIAVTAIGVYSWAYNSNDDDDRTQRSDNNNNDDDDDRTQRSDNNDDDGTTTVGPRSQPDDRPSIFDPDPIFCGDGTTAKRIEDCG